MCNRKKKLENKNQQNLEKYGEKNTFNGEMK